MIKEIWKEVILESHFTKDRIFISSKGRVGKYINSNIEPFTPNRQNKYFVLRAFKKDSKKRSTLSLAKLIGTAFVENPHNHPYIIHLNHIKTDNRPLNLKWATKTEVIYHSQKDPNYTRKSLYNNKLREIDVMRLKLKLKRGHSSISALAKEFKVSKTTIKEIKGGRRWAEN